jgi:uncharacterized protein YueI
LKKPTVEEVLQQGIYGVKETKPEERRKFLGTLRERIIAALYMKQVRESRVYPQIEQYMKDNPKSHLFLNGTINYGELSKYVKMAKKHHINYTIVNNKENETDIGLVLAMEYAIDKEEIYITARAINLITKEKKGLFSKLFKR